MGGFFDAIGDFFGFFDDAGKFDIGKVIDTVGKGVKLYGAVTSVRDVFNDDELDAIAQILDFSDIPIASVPGLEEYVKGRPTVPLPEFEPGPVIPSIPMLPPTAGETAQFGFIGRAEETVQALLRPQDPLTRRLAAEEEEILTGQTARDIRQFKAANRRAAALGRKPVFFGRERADEEFIRQTLEQNRRSRAESKVRARNILSGATRDYISLADQAGSAAQLETGRRKDFLDRLRERSRQMREDVESKYDIDLQNLKFALEQARSDAIAKQAGRLDVAEAQPTAGQKIEQVLKVIEGLKETFETEKEGEPPAPAPPPTGDEDVPARIESPEDFLLPPI